MNPKLALAALCVSVPCWAQTAPAAATAPAAERREANVRVTVIEDDGSKIDELRVRGQVQRLTVTPKVVVTKPYEIIVSRTGRATIDGDPGTNSAVGKSVWKVLDF